MTLPVASLKGQGPRDKWARAMGLGRERDTERETGDRGQDKDTLLQDT